MYENLLINQSKTEPAMSMELYLQPVDGILGDVSCGFNADMHFTALMFLVLITGIAVLIISLVQKDVH